MNKKKVGIITGVVTYLFLSAAVCLGVFDEKAEDRVTDIETVTDTEETEVATEETEPEATRDFTIVNNDIEYARASTESVYAQTDSLNLEEEDTLSIISKYKLPPLTRMAAEDGSTLMGNLQVLKRIDALGIDASEFETPEYNWKAVYNDSITTVKNALSFTDEKIFEGTTASELNQFLATSAQCTVKIKSASINLDQTILIPNNVVLDGNHAVFTGENVLPYAILMDRTKNAGVENVNLQSGFAEGIYVAESSNVLLYNNEVTNAAKKAICVMGTNTYVNLVNNNIHDNGQGAIFLNGNISRCIIQGNAVYQNKGTNNLMAGITMNSNPVRDLYSTDNPCIDEYLYNIVQSPNHIVIKNNVIQSNESSGIYSHAGYMNYVIGNLIEENEKEGMCLDHGTFGTYVSDNTFQKNGNRDRQSDSDLEADFILESGRMEDGTSTQKLPGISLDNAAYNIIASNNINNNYGSGVKMVRSGYRNIIISNIVTDNNLGENESYHGFGIELGYASAPDQPVVGLDFTADYENIIDRNIISGHHFSGIYIGEEDYCNDLIDNVIEDCSQFGVENHSEKFNSGVGNNVNVENLNY